MSFSLTVVDDMTTLSDDLLKSCANLYHRQSAGILEAIGIVYNAPHRCGLAKGEEAAMRKITCSMVMLTVAALLVAGCIPESRSGDVYTRDQARTSQSVNYGTILRVAPVTIEGTQSGAGTVAGGAMGGALGSAVGSGSGQVIATVGGAILGGLAGTAIEKGVTTVQGVEIEVQLDNGELLVVVQENDAVYKVGDRIRVLRDGRGTTRVRQ